MSLVPLYGFLEGDTLGLVVLAHPEDTAHVLAETLERAARVRVAPRGAGGLRVVHNGRELAPHETVASAQMKPLDRIDVRIDARASLRIDTVLG